MRLPTHIMVIVAALFAIVIINLISFFSYRQMKELRVANDRVVHTYKVIAHSSEMFENVLLMGGAGRVYLLTDHEESKDQIEKYKKKSFDTLEELKILTKDNPNQQKNLETFTNILQSRLQVLYELIALKEKKELTNDILVQEIKKSKPYIAQLTALEDKIIAEESELLSERNNAVVENSKRVELYTIIVDIISVIVLLCALILLLMNLRSRTKHENKLQFFAEHDSLTGLVNRNYLQYRLEETIQVCQRHGEMMAVIFLDLDNFKPINDTYGHDAGDAVLQTIAQRLNSSVRKIDTIARLGGDEFIVILSSLPTKENALTPINKLIELIGQEIKYKKDSFYITVSVGVSLYPEDGLEPSILMKNADKAMYYAKKKGGNNVQFYSIS